MVWYGLIGIIVGLIMFNQCQLCQNGRARDWVKSLEMARFSLLETLWWAQMECSSSVEHGLKLPVSKKIVDCSCTPSKVSVLTRYWFTHALIPFDMGPLREMGPIISCFKFLVRCQGWSPKFSCRKATEPPSYQLHEISPRSFDSLKTWACLDLPSGYD